MMNEPSKNGSSWQFSLLALLGLTTAVGLWLPFSGNGWITSLMLYGVFLLYLIHSSKQLPDRVASHFDSRGEPDAWMSCRGFVIFMAVLAGAIPLFFFLIALSIQHAPRQAGAASVALARKLSWLPCLLFGLLFALHMLFVQANRRTPPRISNRTWILIVLFVIAMIVWGIFV